MKVLYLTHYGSMYGANFSLLNLIVFLKKEYGVEPMIILRKNGPIEKILNENKIDYLVLNFPTCMVVDKGRFIIIKKIIKKIMRLIFFKKALKRVRKLYDKEELSIIHSNSSTIDLGYYLAKKMNIPHVWHIREFGKEDYNLIPVDRIDQVRKKYIESSKVVAISNSIERMIRDISRDININMVYNGIEIPEDNIKIFCRKKKVIHFCLVGLISSQKNQIEALRAVKELLSVGYSDFLLHIVGEDYKGELQNVLTYCKENNLETHVIYEGYKKKINLYLQDMDIGIITSKNEAFGRVTIEYMANYMPVIGAANGGTLELIKDNYNGYTYQLGDYMDLANCMKKFLDNKRDIERMGSNARNFSQQFTIAKNAEQIYEIYKKVLISG